MINVNAFKEIVLKELEVFLKKEKKFKKKCCFLKKEK